VGWTGLLLPNRGQLIGRTAPAAMLRRCRRGLAAAYAEGCCIRFGSLTEFRTWSRPRACFEFRLAASRRARGVGWAQGRLWVVTNAIAAFPFPVCPCRLRRGGPLCWRQRRLVRRRL